MVGLSFRFLLFKIPFDWSCERFGSARVQVLTKRRIPLGFIATEPAKGSLVDLALQKQDGIRWPRNLVRYRFASNLVNALSMMP